MDTALSGILEVALQQGIWASLYIYLFFRMLKENAQREEKYQNMIDEPSKERLSHTSFRRLTINGCLC